MRYYVLSDNLVGLCDVIGHLTRIGMIKIETGHSMKSKITAHPDYVEREFIWGTTNWDDCMERVKFCEEQVAALEEGKLDGPLDSYASNDYGSSSRL